MFHYLLWASLILQSGMEGLGLMRKNMLLYVFELISRNALLMGIVYINLLIFIPRLFKQKRVFAYISSLVTVIIGYIWISVVLDNYIYPNMEGWRNEGISWGAMSLFFFTATRYVIISFLFYYIQEQYVQKQKIMALQLEKTRSDLNYLRSQINPHFLFNTFNNLYSLAIDKSEKTPEIIMKLSDMMDYMLYESNEAEVSLEKDVENLQNYIEIERIRQGNNAQIRFHTEGALAGRKIAPLLFLPLVENAFKHGVNNSIENASLEGHLSVNAATILFKLKNNIPTTNSRNGHLSRGIGLENLRKRLELSYPGQYLLETYHKDGIFYTTLKIRKTNDV